MGAANLHFFRIAFSRLAIQFGHSQELHALQKDTCWSLGLIVPSFIYTNLAANLIACKSQLNAIREAAAKAWRLLKLQSSEIQKDVLVVVDSCRKFTTYLLRSVKCHPNLGARDGCKGLQAQLAQELPSHVFTSANQLQGQEEHCSDLQDH